MPTEYKVTFTCPEGAEIDGDTTYRAGNEYSFKVNVLDGYYADSLKVYINGTVIEAAEDGTYTVKEPNGPFYISVEGVKEYEGVVYIALPAEGDGFRVNPCEDYGTTVESGNDFKFTVSFVDGFEAGEEFTVKVNDNEIEPDNDGIYTIENILVKQTITVDGVDVVPSGKTVTVDVEITKGENEFLVANETETIVMDEQLEVPYFDLELYDYAKYYYNPYCYVDKDGNVNGQQKVGTRESAYNVVTTMHAFIYMTEVYYLGYKPKDAGTGYSDTVDSDNDGESDFDEAVSWTQGVGSSFMNLWGLGSNLNYHLNYEYPLGYPEWGSTSDQQALKDGDRISVHMIEGGASGSGFGLFVVNDDNNEYDRGEEVKDQATVKQGETIKLTHYIADQGKNYTTSFVTAGSKQLYWVVEGDESADIREWNYDEENETYNDFGNIVSENFKTDENGVIEIDTTGIEPGTYYIGAAGGFSKGSGEAGNDGFVSRGAESGPAYFKLIVVESPLSEAKANAIAEIEGYKNLDNFREAQKAELESVIDATKAAIEAAESKEAVEAVVADAKVKMDAIKTDAQLTQELNEAKAAANTTVAELKAENIKSENEYRSEQWSNLQDALAAFEQAINNATIAEEVDAALEAVETAIKAVKTRDQEIGALETALTEAIKVNEETKSALETKIAELEAALEDAAKVNVTKAELEKQIAGLKEELSKTLEENATTVEALTAEIETLAADLDKATDLSVKEKAELNAEITALKETLKQTQESNAADKKSLEEKVAGLEKSLAALQTEKAELEKQIADLEKALTDANKSNAETKSALEKQIKDLEKKLADADAASAAEKAELEKQITTLEKTLKETEAANAATVAGLEKDITALETALKDAKDVSAKDKAALEKEIAGLKETLKQTQESNAADKKAFDEKVVSLEKALAAVQAEKAELKKEIAELEQALKDANDLNAKEKAELEAKIAELEAALKELNEEQKLAAPTGLKATNIAKTGKIKISWNAVEGAEEYVVYRAKSKNGKYNKVFATTGTDYTNTNTKAGRTYFYKVKAVTGDKSVDNSDFSEVVKRICKLEKPAVTVKSPKAKQVKVSWKKVKGAKQYVVYRATVKNGKYVKVATTKKLNFTNKKLKSGKTYFYKVKAVANNANANSTFSAIKKCKAK